MLIKILETGSSFIQQPEKRRLYLANTLILVGSTAGVPYSLLFLFLGFPKLALLVIPFVLLFLSSYAFISKGFIKLGKLLIVFSTCLAILTFAFILGPKAGIQIVAVVIAAVSLALFSPREKTLQIVAFIIPFSTMVLLQFWPLYADKISSIQISTTASFSLSFLSLGVAFNMVFLTLRYYIVLNEYHEESLQIALQQVETTLSQLQSAHATLWETNKCLTQKAQFATITQHIAHEIKNPLSLMTNVPDLMSQYAKSPDDIEKIANILRGTIANLYNLVETLLHQNSLSISATSTFELESMVRALLTMSKGDLCLKNVQATLDFESNLPLIYGHEGAIQNVIINLMVNAIQAGATKLEFSAKRTEDGVLFGLRDNAGGIAPEILDRIFEEGFSTKVGNSGFGLTFVKEVLAAQGGKLDITTEQGLGTTFQVAFQINQKLT